MSESFEQFPLSKREMQISTMLMRGKSVRKISEELEISPHTVRNHLKNCFRKLGVSSQVELVTRFASTVLESDSADISAMTLRVLVERSYENLLGMEQRVKVMEDTVLAIAEKMRSIQESLEKLESASVKRSTRMLSAPPV